ncbi:lantibiotic modifying enzyme [Crossiella equi]|uniref:Lantibiotic modifying enzyme n=1 Tax=Crossiella equi TaxID=130796 RepID=A0ABS5ARI4_9PSEU|nr:lanthionine synthetase C family protein [Crossiella equi]MBP2479189.1 lantibiotic modifying enzyme [Crossiella equi]
MLTADTTTSWHGPVPTTLAGRARELAREIARRSEDSARVVEHVLTATEQATHPMGWYHPGFAHGHAGIALLHAHAAEAALDEATRDRSRELAFAFIREAVQGTQVEPLESPGVFSGTSGLALCLAECVAVEPRFAPSLDRLHDKLAGQVADLPLPQVERGVADSDYDMITGAAGTLSYLGAVGRPGARLTAAVHRLVDYLIWLGEPPRDLTLTRRWLIMPEQCAPLGRDARDYPGGYLNLGMAHGIPGALAALASAWLAGHRRPGHERAMRLMTEWVLQVRREDGYGSVWPSDVPVARTGEEVRPGEPRDQVAWCYGTAGVAVALLTVADALADPGLRRVAIESFEAVLRRTLDNPFLSPTFCHGTAGVLAMCLEFAHRTDSALAREHVPVLLHGLLDLADPGSPLVYRDQEEPGVFVDSPSVLSGSAGVALTLLAATSAQRPSWFRAFLTR